jgi:hypothetical protein
MANITINDMLLTLVKASVYNDKGALLKRVYKIV